ncbi:MAG: hypothetical protein KGQ42_03785 [Alphaproteobacteria bacterium]|nr:hypothetical protein [Alphaproteobacteria bacterium]MDE2042846.1 hypothetical protein [Alphaproteobacteria bacterium]MDE2340475.1 hypothetical protein [Alphaproteobacteria bacterium]
MARLPLAIAFAIIPALGEAQSVAAPSLQPDASVYGPIKPQPKPNPHMQSKPKNKAKRFSLTLKAGVAYDSDVAISQINTSTGQSDKLVNLGLSANYKLVDTPKHSFSVGYDFTQSLHASLSNFDIQLHSFSANGSVVVRKATAGLMYSYSHVLLGGHPFLDLQLVSPSVLIPVTHRIFARPNYVYLDERFPISPTYNGTHNQPGMQVFYFFDQAHAFVLLGADYQREKTAGPELTYRGYALSGTLSVPFRVLKVSGKAKADYEWLSRDYDNITASIGVNRYDRASTFKLGAELPLKPKISLGINAIHIGRKSNIAFANLDENIASSELIYRF